MSSVSSSEALFSSSKALSYIWPGLYFITTLTIVSDKYISTTVGDTSLTNSAI